MLINGLDCPSKHSYNSCGVADSDLHHFEKPDQDQDQRETGSRSASKQKIGFGYALNSNRRICGAVKPVDPRYRRPNPDQSEKSDPDPHHAENFRIFIKVI
jgi:hypothetical protein